jgi:hypothetical protein
MKAAARRGLRGARTASVREWDLLAGWFRPGMAAAVAILLGALLGVVGVSGTPACSSPKRWDPPKAPPNSWRPRYLIRRCAVPATGGAVMAGPRWRAAALLVGAFVAGVAVGGIAGRWVGPRIWEREGRPTPGHAVDVLSRRLDLRPSPEGQRARDLRAPEAGVRHALARYRAAQSTLWSNS